MKNVNLGKIKHHMVLNLGLPNVRYSAEQQIVVWTHSHVENIMLMMKKTSDGLEIHFTDVSIKDLWIQACKDKDIELPLTGVQSVSNILAIFQHLFDVCLTLGLNQVNTECRCEKRRRVYLLAAKRLGVQAQEMGENIFFSL